MVLKVFGGSALLLLFNFERVLQSEDRLGSKAAINDQ